MTILSIDTVETSRASRTWTSWGDDVNRAQLDVTRRLAELRMTGAVADPSWSAAAAATDLWTTSVFAELVIDRAEIADVYGASPSFDAASVARLMELAGSRVSSVTNTCPTWMTGFTGPNGDLGGTYGMEVRSPWLLDAMSPEARGRELLLRALADTGSSSQIRNDEFEIVKMSDGRYLVVLPGVTDLSSPDLGLSSSTRTVRDVDQYAYPSSQSTSVADNQYAQMVEAALAENGIPAGSELVLVGHSFGADTALDLAADSNFNGPGGYRVSHVVAAAYYSQPQLEHVPDGTQVLVLQNSRDIPVIAEGVGAHHVTAAVDARGDAIGDLLDLDLPGVFVNTGRALYHEAGATVDAVEHTVTHAGDLWDTTVGLTTGDYQRAIDGMTDFVTLDPGVSRPTDSQVVAVFDGGGEGAGHHQNNYAAYVRTTDDPDVTDFLTSLGRSGADSGSAWAVDVSVPRS